MIHFLRQFWLHNATMTVCVTSVALHLDHGTSYFPTIRRSYWLHQTWDWPPSLSWHCNIEFTLPDHLHCVIVSHQFAIREASLWQCVHFQSNGNAVVVGFLRISYIFLELEWNTPFIYLNKTLLSRFAAGVESVAARGCDLWCWRDLDDTSTSGTVHIV